MKRFLASLLIVLLALGASAMAENVEWKFDEGKGTLIQYTGAGGDVTVPAQIGSVAVKTLDTGVLAQVPDMTSLTLPETVLHIKDNAGSWNPELVRLSLPQSLMVIGSNGFNDCDKLESVTIPAGVRYIGSGAFSDSAMLKRITFEGVCPMFDGEAFADIAAGAAAYVPDDQLNAYRAAFAAMENNITVQPSGKNAVIVDNNGFREADFEFDAASGTITRYNGDAVYLCIPQTIGGVPVKAIGENAFRLNRNLAYAVLPEGLESIGNSAFANCFTLLHVDFPATLQRIGDSAFSGSYLGCRLDIPSVQVIGARAFEHARLRGELTLPDGLESIGEGAFASCTSLKEAYLPATLKSIGAAAFNQNWSLNYIYLDGEELPAVAADAFAGCSALEDIDLNEHCTKQQMLDMQALVDGMGISCRVWRAENSKVDHFNDDLDTYAEGFLTGYTGTETRVRPWSSCNSVQTIGIADGVFKGSRTIEIFAVPHSDNFTTIGAEAFMDSSLREVDLFDSVTTIGARAFANCAQLEELTIPASVTSIGEGAFDGVTGLKKLTILCDPALLPEGSFYADGKPLDAAIYLSADATAEQLAQVSERFRRPWYDPAVRVGEASALVKMPFEATDAAKFDFDAATGTITAYTGSDAEVVIPREINGVTVTAIARNAFEACRDYTNTETASARTDWVRLRSVVIPETVRSIGDDLFSYCQQLETVVCYAPLETTGSTTFMLCRSLNSVVFVNGVREIGSYAFDSAGPLNTLYFGKHLDKIADYAFNHSGISAFVADAAQIGFSFPCCESLTSLHFTARVRSYNENVASDCPNLREICFESSDLSGVISGGLVFKPADKLTVRVPAGTDEANMSKAQSCVSWSDKATEVTVLMEACNHPAPALPDVDALLYGTAPSAAAEPAEPAAAAVLAEAPAPAVPVMAAAFPAEYTGTWYGVSMTMEGTAYSLADMGMEMTLVIHEDGMLERIVNGETETAACTMENGAVIVDGVPATLTDGVLTVETDGVLLSFSREKPVAAAAQTAPADESAALADYLGIWTITSVTADGITLPAETAGMDGETISIYGDTCDITLMGTELTSLPCAMEGNRLGFTLMDATAYLTLHTDGTLDFDLEGATLWYQRTGDAPEKTPTMQPTATPTAEPVPEAMPQPTQASAAGGFDPAPYIGKKFVMTDADMNGYNMTIAMLGGYEYSLIFNDNGTVAFVMAGAAIPGLTWTSGAEGFVIDYYTNTLYAVPSEKGLDMDYFGSMMMHFAAEN